MEFEIQLFLSLATENKSKIEGAKVFAQYNTAVFMVFTSDGYNMYQGSGFLSISMDWLLVITMYSKVQVLVKKVSNLRGQ